MSKSGAAVKKSSSESKNTIVRKMEPTFPFAARAIYAETVMILDFMGDQVSPARREAFASLLLTEDIARDLHEKIGKFINDLDDKNQ